MASEKILYTKAGHVATLTLNDPERRNPLGAQTLIELGEALAQAKADSNVRAVVLTGAGEKAFSAGADLAGFAAQATEIERHHARGHFVEVFQSIPKLGKPLIGAVNGHALAGGLGLALSCDILIASESALFGTPEITVGIWPMMIMSIVTRNLGRKRALELFMTGRRIDSATALEWGLVNRVLPQAEVLSAAQELAAECAQWSPLIMQMGRDAFYAIDDMSLDEQLSYLHAQLSIISLSDDAREGITAFLEKRKPTFTGQ